jgi:hypothetical protein
MHRDFDPDQLERIVGLVGIIFITAASIALPLLASLHISR